MDRSVWSTLTSFIISSCQLRLEYAISSIEESWLSGVWDLTASGDEAPVLKILAVLSTASFSLRYACFGVIDS